jgi:hypothetical protein
MKLAVISHLEHYRDAAGGVLCAWPAAVREIDALASLCGEVVHLACLHPGPPPPQATRYRASNVRLAFVPPAGGPGARGKLGALAAMPERMRAVERAWGEADAALVRCPSNVAAGALALRTLGRGPRRVWVKYTGEWGGRPGEPPSYRLQRAWLRAGLAGTTVTYNGDEEAESGAVALCNPSLSLAEVRAAALRSAVKRPGPPWRFLSVGRLAPDKGLSFAVWTVGALAERGFDVSLDVAGDGPERARLEALARSLRAAVRFHGWLDDERMRGLYREAHWLVAPSRTEGWSRAWSEAAAWRVALAVAAVGSAPQTLERARAGLVLDSADPHAWARRLAERMTAPGGWDELADRGPSLAERFSIERYLEGARTILGLGAGRAAAA